MMLNKQATTCWKFLWGCTWIYPLPRKLSRNKEMDIDEVKQAGQNFYEVAFIHYSLIYSVTKFLVMLGVR